MGQTHISGDETSPKMDETHAAECRGGERQRAHRMQGLYLRKQQTKRLFPTSNVEARVSAVLLKNRSGPSA
jgi:hypothetical protein